MFDDFVVIFIAIAYRFNIILRVYIEMLLVSMLLLLLFVRSFVRFVRFVVGAVFRLYNPIQQILIRLCVLWIALNWSCFQYFLLFRLTHGSLVVVAAAPLIRNSNTGPLSRCSSYSVEKSSALGNCRKFKHIQLKLSDHFQIKCPNETENKFNSILFRWTDFCLNAI